MFVQAEMPLALPFETAARALEEAIAEGGLVSESRRAMADGMQFVMPVGPRGRHFPTRDVKVHLLPVRREDRRLVVPVRWEVTGPGGRLFPALDADLELATVENATGSRLSIVARYHPPLAVVGVALDRLVMSRVASATMTAILREVACQLESPAIHNG